MNEVTRIEAIEQGEGWHHEFCWVAYNAEDVEIGRHPAQHPAQHPAVRYMTAETAIAAGWAWAKRDPGEK